MLLETLTRRQVQSNVLESLRRANGDENSGVGEERLVLSGVGWDAYLNLDAALGHDRPNPRLYYLGGELEITTTSLLHEKVKKWLGLLIEDYLYEAGLEVFPHGQATMRKLKEAGAEPDESWCLGEEKEFADLVLEIVLTSGGIDKLEIYSRFKVPEVWFWHKGELEIWTLRRDGSRYDGPAKASRLLPGLDVALLTRCLSFPSWREARRTFREALVRKVRKKR